MVGGVIGFQVSEAAGRQLPVQMHCKRTLSHRGRMLGISADLCIASEIKSWMAFAHPIIINMSSILDMSDDYRPSPLCESTHLEKMASSSPGSSAALLSRKWRHVCTSMMQCWCRTLMLASSGRAEASCLDSCMNFSPSLRSALRS